MKPIVFAQNCYIFNIISTVNVGPETNKSY